MHTPVTEGYFCDERRNVIKPMIAADYNMHTGYVDKEQDDSHSISRRIWKWTKKLFFHLLELMILNSFVLWCGTVTYISV
jgi:hypothetical protein